LILLGAPHIEQLRGNRKLTAALSTVTAAIVGVILNLAVWFGLHALFPATHTLDWFALFVSVIALVGMLKWQWNVVPVVIGSGIAGLLFQLFT
jgi:chromate transporter